jgi:hypothetical protein
MDNVTLFRINENKNSYLISYKSREKLTLFQISLPLPVDNTQKGNQTA